MTTSEDLNDRIGLIAFLMLICACIIGSVSQRNDMAGAADTAVRPALLAAPVISQASHAIQGESLNKSKLVLSNASLNKALR